MYNCITLVTTRLDRERCSLPWRVPVVHRSLSAASYIHCRHKQHTQVEASDFYWVES